MKLTGQEAREVVWEEHPDWEQASSPEIYDTSRWSNLFSGVFKHLPTDKYYEFCWSQGATECQDEQPFEYEKEVEPILVEKQIVQVEKWVAI